jgi:hypothetical protein
MACKDLLHTSGAACDTECIVSALDRQTEQMRLLEERLRSVVNAQVVGMGAMVKAVREAGELQAAAVLATHDWDIGSETINAVRDLRAALKGDGDGK